MYMPDFDSQEYKRLQIPCYIIKQMWYILYTNDEKNCLKTDRHLFIGYLDNVEAEVSFHVDNAKRVHMKTYMPLTYNIDGVIKTASTGDVVTFPLKKEVFLRFACDPTPRFTKVQVEERVDRARTLPYK